jgi:hypothetical protein
MLAVAVPAPLRLTLLAVHSCTRQHANLLVTGQIVSGLVDLKLFFCTHASTNQKCTEGKTKGMVCKINERRMLLHKS